MKNINFIASAVPGVRYLDLDRGFLPWFERTTQNHQRPRRVALLVKNLNHSGGNVVIKRLYEALRQSHQTRVEIIVVPERDHFFSGFLAYLICRLHYSSATSVKLTKTSIRPSQYDLVISTSRRTLDFVSDLTHPNHVHLFQAVEAWSSENTETFVNFCRTKHYPDARECLELIRNIALPIDVKYLDQIQSISQFQTVSDHLAEFIQLCCGDKKIAIYEPDLPLSGTGSGNTERSIDVLLFLRGFVYNGDDLVLALADIFAKQGYKIAIVLSANYIRRHRAPRLASSNVTVIRDPSVYKLADLYSNSKVVVHPPLCAGGGFMTFEALSFGANVVASRAGWLSRAQSSHQVSIVDRHDPILYLEKIDIFLKA